MNITLLTRTAKTALAPFYAPSLKTTHLPQKKPRRIALVRYDAMNDYAPECMRVSFVAKTKHDGQNLLITANPRDTERDPTGNIMLPVEGAENGERRWILIRVREALSNERSEAVVFKFKK